MTFYKGQFYRQDGVSIGPPNRTFIRSSLIASDVRNSIKHWVTEAQRREDILYFSIFLDQEVIGQIVLHDVNSNARESLVAYHIFGPPLRGQGYGTLGLRLLQSYVMRHTALRKLVIITSRDNLASQRMAHKCGFQYAGGSKEDPVNDMVFEWHAPFD